MNAIEDLKDLCELRERVAGGRMEVTTGSDDYSLEVSFANHGNLRVATAGLKRALIFVRVEVANLMVKALESQIRELLPAAEEELGRARELIAAGDNGVPALQTQGAESAQERQVT